MSHLPSDLWRHINSKQWRDAEESLSKYAGRASIIELVDDIAKGNQRYKYKNGSYYDGCEYPLSTALRIKAPESLILALLKAHASATSVKDEDGLLPINLAFCGGYSSENY